MGPKPDHTCAVFGPIYEAEKQPHMCGYWAHMWDLTPTPHMRYLGPYMRPKNNPTCVVIGRICEVVFRSYMCGNMSQLCVANVCRNCGRICRNYVPQLYGNMSQLCAPIVCPDCGHSCDLNRNIWVTFFSQLGPKCAYMGFHNCDTRHNCDCVATVATIATFGLTDDVIVHCM